MDQETKNHIVGKKQSIHEKIKGLIWGGNLLDHHQYFVLNDETKNDVFYYRGYEDALEWVIKLINDEIPF